MCVVHLIYSYVEIPLNKIILDFGIVISMPTEPFFTFRISQTISNTQTFINSHSQFTVLYIVHTQIHLVFWYVCSARNSYMGNGWVDFKAGILKSFSHDKCLFSFQLTSKCCLSRMAQQQRECFFRSFFSFSFEKKIIVSKVVYSIMHCIFETRERYLQKYFHQMHYSKCEAYYYCCNHY